MAKIKSLRENPFFADFSNKEIAVFSRIVEERAYTGGDEIFSESSNSSGMYLIKTGRVEVVKDFEDEGVITLGSFGTGEVFGQLSLIDAGAHLVAARAAEDTEALFISKENFEQFNEENQIAANKLLTALARSLATQLRQTSELFTAYIARRPSPVSEKEQTE